MDEEYRTGQLIRHTMLLRCCSSLESEGVFVGTSQKVHVVKKYMCGLIRNGPRRLFFFRVKLDMRAFTQENRGTIHPRTLTTTLTPKLVKSCQCRTHLDQYCNCFFFSCFGDESFLVPDVSIGRMSLFFFSKKWPDVFTCCRRHRFGERGRVGFFFGGERGEE